MTTKPARKKISAWKILGIVVGVILLSIVALILWAMAAASRKFARMEERSRAHLAVVRAVDGRRPVLRGDPEEGNAWDDYALAQAEVKKIANVYRLSEIVLRSPKADLEAGKAALAAHGVAIDHLRRGAGRASSHGPYDWEKGFQMTLPGNPVGLANLAILQARALVAEGKSREAAGVLLDVCQLGRDAAADGVLISYMIGMAILNNAFNEIREHLVAGSFDKAAVGDLVRGLGTLDGGYPRYGPVMINEALLFSGGALEEAGKGPTRFLHADALEQWADIAARMAAEESLPWAEVQERARSSDAPEHSWNPVLKLILPPRGPIRIARQRKAQLRILRVALQVAASGALLDLDDPFGAKLKFDEKPGTLKIWSIGPDGVDDGGVGDWKGDAKDIVLEMKR